MPKHTHFLIVMFALCLTGQTISQKKTATENPSELAQTNVSYLANKNNNDAVSCFDSTMNSLMPTKQTREIWEDLLQKLGSFQKQLSVRTEKYLQYDIVFVTCQFDSAQIDVKVVCNPQRQIAGLFFVPVKLGQEYNTPDYGAKVLRNRGLSG